MLARASKHVQTEQSFTTYDYFNFILKGSKPNSRLSPFGKMRESLQLSVLCFCQCYLLSIPNKVFVFKRTLSISSTITSV